MVSMFPVPLMLRPPASKQTPFPIRETKSSGFSGLPNLLIHYAKFQHIPSYFMTTRHGLVIAPLPTAVNKVETFFLELLSYYCFKLDLGVNFSNLLTEL